MNKDAIIGFLLGVFGGFLLLAIITWLYSSCPHCDSMIRKKVEYCPHCYTKLRWSH